MKTTIKLLTNSGKMQVQVAEGTTLGELMSTNNIASGMKAMSGATTLGRDDVITGYKIISFSAATKGAGKAQKMVALMSTGLRVAVISYDSINFGNSEEIQELRKDVGTDGFMVVVPTNIAIQKGDVAVLASPAQFGMVSDVRKLSVDELDNMDVFDMQHVVGKLDIGDYDAEASAWDKLFKAKTASASVVLEDAARAKAIEGLTGNFHDADLSQLSVDGGQSPTE